MFAPSDPARPHVRRAPTGSAVAIFVGVLGAAALWRWCVLQNHGDPVGVDFGNWLALGRALGGRHVSGGDAVYPPLIPALARAATAVLGVPAAARVTAAVAATMPAAGVWIATRPSVGVRWATAGAIALLAAGATSAAAAWGGVPQLVGLGLAPVVAVAASTLVADPSRRQAVVLGLLLLALALLSPLVLGLTLVVVALTVALASVVIRTGRWIRFGALSLAFLLPVVPLYATFLSSATVHTNAAGAGSLPTHALGIVFVGATGWWYVLGTLAVVAPFLAWRHRFDPLWAASTALTTVAVVAALAIGESRFSYLAPTAAVIGAVMLGACAPKPVRRPLAIAVVLSVVGILVAGPRTMQQQRDEYASFVPRGTAAAISWIRANTSAHDLLAVAPVAGAPFGWWLEGWAQRPSLVAANPAFLAFPGERRRARQATGLFTAAHWPNEATFARARRLGVRWLYVPAAWDGINRVALRSAEARHAGLLVYDGPGALVLRTPGA